MEQNPKEKQKTYINELHIDPTYLTTSNIVSKNPC